MAGGGRRAAVGSADPRAPQQQRGAVEHVFMTRVRSAAHHASPPFFVTEPGGLGSLAATSAMNDAARVRVNMQQLEPSYKPEFCIRQICDLQNMHR